MKRRVFGALTFAASLTAAACGSSSSPEVLQCTPTGNTRDWQKTVLISDDAPADSAEKAVFALAGEVKCNTDVSYGYTTVGHKVPVKGFVELCLLHDFTHREDQLRANRDPQAASKYLLAVCPSDQSLPESVTPNGQLD